MSESKVDLFWAKKWVEALVMLPLIMLVAVFSSQYADGWWLISVLLGMFIVEQIYRHVMFSDNGRLSSISKGQIAFWLFGIQLFLVASLAGLLVFLS